MTRGTVSPGTRWYLKLDGRAGLERLEGRVPTLHSIRVTAGRGGGGMLAVLVLFVRLFMSFLHLLPHLLVHHHSRSYHARSQGIHRRHARGRWWVWRGIGALWLVSWVPWLWHRIRGSTWGKGWIPMGNSWRGGAGRWRKGRIDRWWWMCRTGSTRIPHVRGIWIWSWMPSTRIPHVQLFLQPLHPSLV